MRRLAVANRPNIFQMLLVTTAELDNVGNDYDFTFIMPLPTVWGNSAIRPSIRSSVCLSHINSSTTILFRTTVITDMLKVERTSHRGRTDTRRGRNGNKADAASEAFPMWLHHRQSSVYVNIIRNASCQAGAVGPSEIADNLTAV